MKRSVLCICLMLILVFTISGCGAINLVTQALNSRNEASDDKEEAKATETPEETKEADKDIIEEESDDKEDEDKKSESDDKEDEDKKSESDDKEDTEKDDNVIVAEKPDTSSKFSFTVNEAIIGMTDYTEIPVVVLAGTFTNNSDEAISFSWALNCVATQGDYSLSTTYLDGASDFNYNDIAPGATIPVFIGWEILDSENDITLKVIDSQHYAQEEIYNQTFTIDELVNNTLNYEDSDEVIDSPLEA